VPLLVAEVLQEARDPAGTWSLATHGRVRDCVHGWPAEDVDLFLTQIVDRFVAPDTSMGERFKLAQLCTMCNQAGPGKVSATFSHCRDRILGTAEAQVKGPLGPAITKLISSLYEPPKPKPRRSSDFITFMPTVMARKTVPVTPMPISVEPGFF
jgi:hypothetical protein